jgi:hypothetical protein
MGSHQFDPRGEPPRFIRLRLARFHQEPRGRGGNEMETLTIKSVHPEDILRWIARIWSLVGVGMLLFFLTGDEFHPDQLTAHEWASLILFPTGVTFGLVVAWRWEALGGAITVASLAAFYLLESFFVHALPTGWVFLALAIPGCLFLLSAALTRREIK